MEIRPSGATWLCAVSAEEAWAIGWRSGTCAICDSRVFVAQHKNGAWSAVLPDQAIVNAPAEPIVPALLNDVTFTGPNNGWAVGLYTSRVENGLHRALIIRYHDGAWRSEILPNLPLQPAFDPPLLD